jgi:hypothetical protein
MENFLDYLFFWLAAAVIYSFYRLGQIAYKDLFARYIVWTWKRRK